MVALLLRRLLGSFGEDFLLHRKIGRRHLELHRDVRRGRLSSGFRAAPRMRRTDEALLRLACVVVARIALPAFDRTSLCCRRGRLGLVEVLGSRAS